MRLKEAYNDKKFDVRVQDKHVGEKKITSEELNQFIASLEDDSSKMITTEEYLKQKSQQKKESAEESSSTPQNSDLN